MSETMKASNNILKASAVAMCMLMLGSAGSFATNAAKPRVQSGKIKEVEMNQHQLVITDRKDNSAHRFQWNDRTQFTEHGKKIAPAELKVGEMARLTYTPGSEIPIAQRVRLAPTKMARHTAARYPAAGHS